MILLYRLFFLPALFLILPAYVPRMLRRGGYRRHFGQRLGLWPRLSAKSPGVPRIWIHAVSVGEILAIKPLIRRLQEQVPSEIILTTTTSTAYALAERELARELKLLAYFPLDFWFFSRRVWEIIQPDASVLMEAEIWPEHLHQARRHAVPVALVNARMSERSFSRWQKMPRTVRALFAEFYAIIAASTEDYRRFVDLGAPEDRVLLGGNLKLDFVPSPILDERQLQSLRRDLGLFDPGENTVRPLVLAGASTWPGEEEMLLRVWERLRSQNVPCRLLLVPRHAERARGLRGILGATGHTVHFRTDGSAHGPVDLVVADTTGEMVRLLQVADVVFVGKSMEQNQGGQNPIEAAALSKAVLFGPQMQNFRAIAQSMRESGAAVQVRSAEELLAQAKRLLGDPTARQKQGEAARKWHEAGKGATELTFAVLRDMLSKN
jgi:3-deoxy-D-manno-octulosonic-acid transferase